MDDDFIPPAEAFALDIQNGIQGIAQLERVPEPIAADLLSQAA